jgi:hypothetical protein
MLALTLILVQSPTPSITRSIQGVVTTNGTMDAIPDAEVAVAIDKSDLDTVIAAYKYDLKFPVRTTSDGSGRFSVGGIVPGKFIVTVQHDGFFAKPPDGKGDLRDSASLRVTVLPDQEGQALSVSMIPGAVVGGRVSGMDGRAVSSVNVQALTQYMENGVTKTKLVASRETNDEGVYRLFWLPPGEYVVGITGIGPYPGPGLVDDRISSQKYLKTFYPNAADESTATRITVKSGDDLGSIDISLRPASADDLRSFPPRPPPPPLPPGR